LSNVITGRTGISLEMAIRLAKTFGGSDEHWLQLQLAYDLAEARKRADQIEVTPCISCAPKASKTTGGAVLNVVSPLPNEPLPAKPLWRLRRDGGCYRPCDRWHRSSRRDLHAARGGRVYS
jgi:hypothetical protein